MILAATTYVSWCNPVQHIYMVPCRLTESRIKARFSVILEENYIIRFADRLSEMSIITYVIKFIMLNKKW